MAKKIEWKYETTVARVEDILDEIESGELEFTEVFDKFAIAVESLQQCEDFLAKQRSQVDLLLENLGDR
ncbi:exodeoxyribonuclease VII small subunit [Chamaesiphon polymorphus]|uniref:Exodeoxyribonuclease VII small subunit n=1 Tax=Chamaesiphon polymorphus CCALA 037 TaxID=2107692 RepID=A0A2T1G086_9CYAN|nr:exodeoxyribonuclease VII small subunit [Chamaesiphon polymorphus]PSB50631.1 exodeoxyribonuclease VII small subunit [Chamaesiphon polymorphus CCALA 037]